MRSYRDGDRIFQNSLVFIIFCYSFDNRYILSFLGNHYSLTFQIGNQHQTQYMYVVRKIYCDPFSHVMDRCQFTQQLQQQRNSFNKEACTMAFTYLGRANMIAHAQWPLCLPFPYVHLFYVTPALLRGHLQCQFSVSSAMGM